MSEAVFVRACPLAKVPAESALGLEIDGDDVYVALSAPEGVIVSSPPHEKDA